MTPDIPPSTPPGAIPSVAWSSDDPRGWPGRVELLDPSRVPARFERRLEPRVDDLTRQLGGSGNGEAMAANRVRGVRCALCWSVETARLGRQHNDANMIAIGERLAKADADLVSLSEKIDTSSATGKMVFRLLSVLAEFEADLVSERTTAALAAKRANGERTGQVPYGHDLADDGVTLVPNKAEQAVLADILAMREAGVTLQGITDALTERGVPTKTGNTTWNLWTVRGILKRVATKRG